MVHPKRFKKIINDYLNEHDLLKPLVSGWANEEALIDHSSIKAAHYSNEQRKLLHDVLQRQNEELTLSPDSRENLSKILNSNCLTITTGHQLNLALGPVFVWYKILSVVQTCRFLNAKQKAFEYVPVFWMASEDHDLDEINHIYYNGLKFAWNTDQTGAVGPMQTAGIADVLEKFKKALGREVQSDFIDQCIEIYNKADHLAAATRGLINTFFGAYGLLVLDGNDPELKASAKSLFQKDFETSFLEREVLKTNSFLKENNYHIQVNPREINLFYLEKNIRSRWVKQEGMYSVKDHPSIKYSKEALLDFVEKQTASVSPNAIMRPLYQEMVLPNVAYVGGAGELAYWLQLKAAFDSVALPFPILIMRHQAIQLSSKNFKKIEKLKLDVEDFFNDLESLKKQVVKKYSPHDFTFLQERKILENLFDPIVASAKQTDLSYEDAAKAARHRSLKELDKLQKKLMRAEKKRLANLMERLELLYDEIYPDGVFQERRLALAELMSQLSTTSKKNIETQFKFFNTKLISFFID